MKIALYQMKMDGIVRENLEKCLNAIKEAAENGADLILFPELTLLPFFPQYEGLDVTDKLVTEEHELIDAFQRCCMEHHIYAVPNFYLEQDGKAYDASLVIDKNGEVIGIQKMVHVAQAEQFYEQDYYTPAEDGFLVFDTELGQIGIVVCFDRHYPESIRTESLMGADVVLIPTANTKAEPLQMFEWEVRVQAFQNCVPVLMCNRVGPEGEMDFAGESLAVDATGELLAKADDTEQILYAEIDMQQAGKVRNARPYTNLRRPECYR